jgi:hypothetical protein
MAVIELLDFEDEEAVGESVIGVAHMSNGVLDDLAYVSQGGVDFLMSGQNREASLMKDNKRDIRRFRVHFRISVFLCFSFFIP